MTPSYRDLVRGAEAEERDDHLRAEGNSRGWCLVRCGRRKGVERIVGEAWPLRSQFGLAFPVGADGVAV